MRRVFLAVAIAAAAVLAAAPASAQVRAQNYGAPRVQRLHKIPPVIILPRVVPPSSAVGNVLGRMPQARALGVKLKGPLYIVKVKQGNVIRQVRVNATTGDILP